MGQTEQKWNVRNAYRGLHWQLLRTTALLLPIYTTLDVLRRKTTALNSLSGNFLCMFLVTGSAYAITWPIETLKNLAQAGTPRVGASPAERMAHMGGLLGLMRGVTPGAAPARFV
jgi:hypothetical protein